MCVGLCVHLSEGKGVCEDDVCLSECKGVCEDECVFE